MTKDKLFERFTFERRITMSFDQDRMNDVLFEEWLKENGPFSLKEGRIFSELKKTLGIFDLIVIGIAGGEGEWIQSGGTAVFSSDFYVGGSRTNEMKCTNMACEGFWTRNDSKGLLDISGGTLDVGNANMIVSAFGKGEIALSGNGLIKVKNLILSNTVDMVTSQRYILTAEKASKKAKKSQGIIFFISVENT